MAACNQTDIPVLNIQEDPCIQGSLITSCIFYGLAIDYLGAQSSSSFFDVLGLIVAKLEAGNIDATNLEEDNRAQALLIEALQNSIAESLVTLSEIQVLLEQCCPEPTTTTVAPTTTTIPTSTTTTTNGSGPTINANYSATPCDTSGGFQTVTLINGTSICDPNVYLSSGFYMLPTQFYITYQGYSRLFAKDSQSQFAYPQGSCIDCSTSTTTTTATNSYSYTVSASSSSDRNYTCSNPYTSGQQTLWADTYIPGDVQKFYTDSNLTNPYLGNVNDYYAYMIGWPSGILYVGQMGADGTMFNKSTCQQATTTTTTIATTTTTTPINAFDVWVTNFDTEFWTEIACEAPRVTVYSTSTSLTSGAKIFRNSNLTNEVDNNNIVYVQVYPFGSSSNIQGAYYLQATGLGPFSSFTTCNAPTSTTTTTATPTTTTTVAPGLTCPEGFPNRTTGNGTMTLSNGVTLTTIYTGPTLLSGNFNPPFTACGNSFKGNDGAGGTMYLNYTGGAFTLTLTFSQPQSHIAFGIFGMGIYNQPGTTESYTFTTNGGGTQITELNGCGNFQVQGFNTLVGSNNNGTASDGSGAIQVTSSGLFTEVTITGNNSGSLNGVGIDLYLCSNLIIE